MAVPIGPGDVIDGTYVIERLLGEGGMGAVFIAREERLGRRVAIKVLLSTVADNSEAKVRFEREARSAAVLQSDHVTRVLSVGHLADRAPYIVMELLEGQDLAATLASRGPLPIDEVIGYVTQVCDALSEAHALGIVHRDLKPANIFLARRPTGGTRVKVLDFGISKGATGVASEALTRTTAIMGTPLYMSPEQLREARNVDGRADLWALGIIMYELVSGRPPFVSDALAELCVLIMTTPHEPLSARRPGVPPAFDAIVNRCLEKDAAKRFATAHDLVTALSSIGSVKPAPLPPRMATPRMNPSPMAELPTHESGPQTRARMHAPTQAKGQSEAELAPPPVEHAQTPAQPGKPWSAAPTPLMTPPQNLPRAPMSATVDPVSTTQPWMPSKGPQLLLVVAAFVGALVVGGITLYVAVLRTPASERGGAAAASGGSASSGLVMSSSSPSAIASSSTASPSSASASPSAIASEPTPSAMPSAAAVSIPAGTTGARPSPPSVASAHPAAPLPPPGVVVRPPVVPPAVVTAPSAHVAPSARPTASPTPNPGSLMPGARN